MSQPSAVPSFRMRRLRRRALIAAGVLAAGSVAAAPARGATLQPESAAAFRDSVGVQTHFSFPGFAYDTPAVSDLQGLLRQLGIRHLRDDTCFLEESACTRVRQRMADLRDTFGTSPSTRVQFNLLISRELASTTDRATRDADLARALGAVTTPPLAGLVDGIEQVNEPDLKNTPNWAATTLADTATLRRLLGEPRYAPAAALPLLSPALGRAGNTQALLDAGWSGTYADLANAHPYPPAWGGPEGALDVPCGAMTTEACATKLATTGTLMATESGYTTAGSILSTSWVSERAQAVYLPRLLLDNFRRGVRRTYLYELVDRKPSSNSLTSAPVDGYGLYRARQSGAQYFPSSPKPAALAVARMNATIGDLGAAAPASAPLDVSIRVGGRDVGDDQIRRVLLQRADGSYVLALWQPKAVWQNGVMQQRDLTVDPLDTDVTIGSGSWSVTATRPSSSDAVTGQWSSTRSWNLPVGADVTLLELRNDGGAPTPQPAPSVDVLGAIVQLALQVAGLGWLAQWLGAALANSGR